MKIVRPEWLVDSAKSGELLSWQDFPVHPEDRVIESEVRRAAQTSLFITGQQKDSPVPENPKRADQPVAVAVASDQATLKADYAFHKSNPFAERAMANPGWRTAHTSAAPDFIEGFYKNSRLHHLSTWKAELKKLVQEAQERAEEGLVETTASTSTNQGLSMKGAELIQKSLLKKGKERAKDVTTVIMHCDFDSFFVSAGLVERPHLRGKPIVVCHSQGAQGGDSSTSEIASASYEAREFGIKNGMRFVRQSLSG